MRHIRRFADAEGHVAVLEKSLYGGVLIDAVIRYKVVDDAPGARPHFRPDGTGLRIEASARIRRSAYLDAGHLKRLPYLPNEKAYGRYQEPWPPTSEFRHMRQYSSTKGTPVEALAAVRLNAISKSFGNILVLDEVDFEVRRGEIHALLGENGAGKSTLLKILCGVEAPDAGTIEIDGKRLPKQTTEACRRAGIASIFSESSLVPTLTVSQNIFLNHEPRNRLGLIDDQKALEKAQSLLEDFGVSIAPTTLASELKPFHCQQSEILRAVLQHSRILVLDATTTVLSETELECLNGMLTRLKSDGITIIYVSHRMEEIMQIADRATILRGGRRVITAPLSDLTLEMIIEYVMGGRTPGSRSLHETELRFQQLAQNIHEVFWMVDPRAKRLLYVSPGFEQIWGRPCEAVYPDSGSFLETVHKDDRRCAAAGYAHQLDGQLPIEHEYRIQRPDGTICWIRDRGFPICDQNGERYRLVRITEDITERKRVEGELQNSLTQLRSLTARLQSIREEERKTVAREIHDELGQALTSIKLDLSSWVRELALDPKNLPKRPLSILKLVDQTIQTVRRISTELRPGILDDLGLVAAVEWASEEFADRTGTECHLDLPDEIMVDQDLAIAVFRILQETLTNVARHANASQLNVRMVQEAGSLYLEVRDNGCGVNEETLSARGSLGILGMRERALLLGGELTIRGVPGYGTSVTVRLPV
jgi:PAS domain S-box-containing protein